jgi:hypothetical protein
MARAGRKTQEMKHFSFRMRADVYQDYATVAEARGVDLSALLNWILTEYRPVLLSRHAQYMAALLSAAVAGLPQGVPRVPDNQEALAKAKELLAQVQEVASTLAGQPVAEQRREAG